MHRFFAMLFFAFFKGWGVKPEKFYKNILSLLLLSIYVYTYLTWIYRCRYIIYCKSRRRKEGRRRRRKESLARIDI